MLSISNPIILFIIISSVLFSFRMPQLIILLNATPVPIYILKIINTSVLLFIFPKLNIEMEILIHYLRVLMLFLQYLLMGHIIHKLSIYLYIFSSINFFSNTSHNFLSWTFNFPQTPITWAKVIACSLVNSGTKSLRTGTILS